MKKQKMNMDWYFWKECHESEKKKIHLPHDAMLEEERVPDLEKGNATGFYPGGKYIYVKSIWGDQAYAGKSIIVEFEGIYMKSTVLLNQEEVGGWVYGYNNFYVDLTDKLRIGEENELKVIVDNSMTPNSRWYSGSGIYRDVNLYVGEKEHIVPDGIRITTISYAPAIISVNVESTAADDSNIVIEIMADNQKIAEGKGASCELIIPKAKLWSAESPYLYDAKVTIEKDGCIIDEVITRFGIRKLAWNAKKGLQINGETVKLKGGCIHHDNGPLGACSYYKSEYRRVKKLKNMGYNAIRYSHNPTNRTFLDICDELGMYVLDETFDQWKLPQSTYDYALYFDSEWQKDIEALIHKDYSHPSVIMYCVGNEITDTGVSHGALICRAICNKVHELDATRPTTIAINSMLSVLAAKIAEKKAKEATMTEAERKKAEDEKTVGSAEVNDIMTLLPQIKASITPESLETLIKDVLESVDIVGYNYNENLYEGTHHLAPNRVILSSETFPRMIGKNWPMVEHTPYVIGDFMWTAWDYLGEAGVGLPVYGTSQAPFSKEYPCLTAACGSVDITGYVESQGYYTAIVFGAYEKPYIAVRPVDHAGEEYSIGLWRLTDAVNSWSWPGCEGRQTEIEVYSTGNAVELLQDGVSLGRKELELYRASYNTEYRSGILEAVSYDENGNEMARERLVSAKGKEQITILPEETEIYADGTDLVYINIQITDEKGIPFMLRDRKLNVSVMGAGRLLALGSGNPETVEKFSDSTYTTYHGRLLAIVQSTGKTGEIKICVSGEGFKSEEYCIWAK